VFPSWNQKNCPKRGSPMSLWSSLVLTGGGRRRRRRRRRRKNSHGNGWEECDIFFCVECFVQESSLTWMEWNRMEDDYRKMENVFSFFLYESSPNVPLYTMFHVIWCVFYFQSLVGRSQPPPLLLGLAQNASFWRLYVVSHNLLFFPSLFFAFSSTSHENTHLSSF
jgi:hypothetical protein